MTTRYYTLKFKGIIVISKYYECKKLSNDVVKKFERDNNNIFIDIQRNACVINKGKEQQGLCPLTVFLE